MSESVREDTAVQDGKNFFSRPPMGTAKLKALSNPIRREILTMLEMRRNARGTDLAEALNIPSNKVSFHLRVLAEAGLIEEAPELARDRRDRVWRAVDTPFDLGQAGQTEENIALSNALMEVFADEHRELLHKVMVFADQNMRASEDLGSHAIFTSATLYLSDEQFKRAVQQFMENIRESAHSNETIVEEGRAVDEGLHQWHIDLLAADETI